MARSKAEHALTSESTKISSFNSVERKKKAKTTTHNMFWTKLFNEEDHFEKGEKKINTRIFILSL